MSKHKRKALILALLMTAVFCAAGFTRKEEVLQASKNIETETVDEVEEVVRFSEWKLKEEEKQNTMKEKAQEQAEAERIAAEAAAAEAERIAAEEAKRAATSSGDMQSLLASIIYCEAGNQPYEGQVAVGAVVMNRVRSEAFPNTVEEVIYQPGQFVPAMTGWLDEVRSTGAYTDTAMQAAADVLAGVNPVGNCLFFDQGGDGMQIGAHYFH